MCKVFIVHSLKGGKNKRYRIKVGNPEIPLTAKTALRLDEPAKLLAIQEYSPA